jgi:hypothetical protein
MVKLTNTKRRILDCIGQGMKQKDIAGKLKITESAISRHVQQLEFCNLIRLSARSSFKAWELHPDYLKFKRKKVNFVSASASHELTKNDIQLNQLPQKVLTSEAPADNGSQPTSPNPLREQERSSVHHLFISIPLRTEGRVEFEDHPNELNNVYEHYRGLGDMTMKLYECKRTKLVVSALLMVKLKDFDPRLDPKPQIHGIFQASRDKGVEYLKSLGLDPDENIAATDIHIARMDEISIEDGKILNKQRFYLPRFREKLTPHDPDQQAYIEFDKTPGPADNEETNDMEHDRRRAMMAENIHELMENNRRMLDHLGSIARSDTGIYNLLTIQTETLRTLKDLIAEKQARELRKGHVITHRRGD